MLGLEEWVTIVKSPMSTICVRADGRRQHCEQMKQENAQRWVDRFGYLDPALVAELRDASPDTIFHVVVHFVLQRRPNSDPPNGWMLIQGAG